MRVELEKLKGIEEEALRLDEGGTGLRSTVKDEGDIFFSLRWNFSFSSTKGQTNLIWSKSRVGLVCLHGSECNHREKQK
jgi:hypothetical protein